MARNNKKHDPLRKEEIKIVQERQTEAVLQAVLMYTEENVSTAVSKARRFLRDEVEEAVVDERYKDILLQDDRLSVPDSVLSQNRNPRLQDKPSNNTLLGGDDDDFLSEFSSSSTPERKAPVVAPNPFPDTENEPLVALSDKPKHLPSKSAPSNSQQISRRETRSDNLSQKKIRAQEMREAKEEEYILNSTAPADDDDYDFLDSEPESATSLLIPENSGWDEWEEEEAEDDIPKRTENRPNIPKPNFVATDDDEDEGEGEVISQREFEEMWSFGEIKQDKKPNSVSAKDLYDDLF